MASEFTPGNGPRRASNATLDKELNDDDIEAQIDNLLENNSFT